MIPLFFTHGFCGMNELHETLQLLNGKHPQRVAQPRRRTTLLRSQPVVEHRRHDNAEIRFGLAASGGEPEHVGDVEFVPPPRIFRMFSRHKRRQDRHDEDDLEQMPLCDVATSRLVHKTEGLQEPRVFAETCDAETEGLDLLFEQRKILGDSAEMSGSCAWSEMNFFQRSA